MHLEAHDNGNGCFALPQGAEALLWGCGDGSTAKNDNQMALQQWHQLFNMHHCKLWCGSGNASCHCTLQQCCALLWVPRPQLVSVHGGSAMVGQKIVTTTLNVTPFGEKN